MSEPQNIKLEDELQEKLKCKIIGAVVEKKTTVNNDGFNTDEMEKILDNMATMYQGIVLVFNQL